MAYNETNGLIDKFDGLKDIDNKLIRVVGNLINRFNEDALRMLRAIVCKLNFDIEINTYKAIIVFSNNLAKVIKEYNLN